MKYLLLAALMSISLSASSQSVIELIDKKLEEVSKPFQSATIYGSEFAAAIIDGAVTNPDEVKVGECKLNDGIVELTYYSPKYRLVIYLKEDVDSLDFTKIYLLN
jgi:hypothetical protein